MLHMYHAMLPENPKAGAAGLGWELGSRAGSGGSLWVPKHPLSGAHKLKATRASIISISRVRGEVGMGPGQEVGGEFVGPETTPFRDPQTQLWWAGGEGVGLAWLGWC